MELKPGFKQTEVGVIPEDWEVVLLRQLILSVEYGSSAKSNVKGDTPVLRMGNLQNGKIDWGDLVYTNDESEIKKYALDPGDVLFNRTNTIDLVGKTSIYRGERPAIFAGYLIRIKVDQSRLDSEYLNFVLNAEFSKRHSAKVLSVAVGQANINGQKVKTYPIPLPPTLFEQKAIAEALSDVDALIESLEQLIAKKRAVKQGAMQVLLRPKDGWIATKLGNLGSFLKGSGIKKDEALSGDLPCVRYGEIYTRHNDYIRDFSSWISPAVAATARRLRVGDVLFAGSGETKEDIGKCVAFLDDIEAYAGGDVIILRQETANSMFLGYYLNTPAISRQKASKGQGDAIVHVSSAALADIDLSLPLIDEQAAVATILSDMDAEIAALEQRRDKTKLLKQGMMQDLLTGKTRLV